MNGPVMGGATMIGLGYEYGITCTPTGKAQGAFAQARRSARLAGLLAAVTGRTAELPSWAELEQDAQITGQHNLGMRPVPLSAITGTVGRSHDFDSRFNPTQERTRSRWESVARAMMTGVSLPAVDLYKVGDRYFVKDGNHRVSVAKWLGIKYIDAEVLEIEVCSRPGVATCIDANHSRNRLAPLTGWFRTLLGHTGHSSRPASL